MARKNKDLKRSAQRLMKAVDGGWEGNTADIRALLKLKNDVQCTTVKNYVKQGYALLGKSWQWDYHPTNGEPRFVLESDLEGHRRLFEGSTEHAAEATHGLGVPLLAAERAQFITGRGYRKAVNKTEELASGISGLAAGLRWRVGRKYLERSRDL